MAPSTHEETERKYNVDAATVMPALNTVKGVAGVRQAVTHDLEAFYFDTPDLDLIRHHVTLRRRTGGADSGWHLKLPADGDSRTEVRLPLDASVGAVPDELLAPVRGIVRDHPLKPVARLRTHRLAYAIVDDQAAELGEVSDDTVMAERLVGDAAVQQWREWEVEVVGGGDTLLDAIEEALLAAGATPADTRSKLARTLADALPSPDQPDAERRSSGPTTAEQSARDLPHASAEDALKAYLAEHTAQLREQDARVRADEPGSIHKSRIAARRLRSALTTYRPILVRESTEPVRAELRWLGQTLGAARDAQVLRERLDHLLNQQPAELVLGAVAGRIDGDLSTAYHTGRREAVAALDGERYFRLLATLDALVASPPVVAEAQQPASEVLPRLLARDTKRLRRAVRAVKAAEQAEQRDLALHEARKKAKRLRYAADSAVSVFGARAEDLSASAKKVQEALGLHQDAVVARGKLREYAVQAHLGGDNGFTFGRLHGLEEWRADEAERVFRKAWKKVPHRKVRNWITQ